ncbi:DUF5131 family protein [Tautonia sp. JC769]|uniref:DUF5131 family protein n=1 Tax=Tautonia sp. JC769 TaxID=3232135 RepID=UPI00345B0976
MSQKTAIQWCDSTVNPTTGCDGCELWQRQTVRNPEPRRSCYAGPVHEGRLARSLPALYAPDFSEVRLAPGRMADAAAWPDLRGKPRPDKPWIDPSLPRLIFVGDMGDVFSSVVHFHYLRDELLAAIDSPKGRRHVWLILTKRPSRFAEFAEWLDSPLPPNLWAGTSITGKASLPRIDALNQVPAARRFLSVEPLVEPVGLGGRLAERWQCDRCKYSAPPRSGWGFNPRQGYAVCGTCQASGYDIVPRTLPGIDWVIVGGESGATARPFDVSWARSIRDQCRADGVPFFLKQLGSKPYSPLGNPMSRRITDSHGGDWSEWPEDLQVREFPSVAESLA